MEAVEPMVWIVGIGSFCIGWTLGVYINRRQWERERMIDLWKKNLRDELRRHESKNPS